jgi:predicted nucleic acid-binding protein
LVTGTAGILLVAKRHRLVSRIRPYLDALIEKSFFIGSDLYDDLLRLAGEYEA